MKNFLSNAKWIGSGDHVVTRLTDEPSPALQLRKTFPLTAEQLRKPAVCRICGLGCYVFYINGNRVGDDVLSPAFTAYDKRVLYVEYDVKEYLREGENVVAVKLGNGFFNQTTQDTWGFYQSPWRDCVKLLFELCVEDKAVCNSDGSWKCSSDGATVHNAIRTGEWYDAGKEDGWEKLGYDDSFWRNACVMAPMGRIVEKMTMPPIRECETFSAVDMWRSEKGWVLDFGKNISGYVGFTLFGAAGETLVLRYAEKLNGKEIDQSNIDCYVWGKREFSTDKYTFKGVDKESWKPQFVYHGFRYVEVSGLQNEPPMSAFTAYFVHTDLARRGTFSCSDELLNWIYEAGHRSFLSNYHGFSEDCPHREKNGWTGDAAISCDYAVRDYDMKEVYKKWLKDMCDAQRNSGQLPGIVPTAGWGFNWGSGPAWDCALFFLPYALYKETGDTECFDVVYDAAEKYLQYVKYHREEGLVCFGLSDWCPPEDMPDLKIMDNRLSDSCYYYKMQKIMSEMADLRKDAEKAERYRKEAEETRKAIVERYIRDDVVDNDGQGALAEALYFEIVSGTQAEKIAKKLVKTVREDGYKFKVGILGMKALLNALSAYGYTEEAYKMVARYDYPSYGYWKTQGATTLWENWNGSGSLNHHMYADVVHWMGRYIGGVQNGGVAYEKCVLQPCFFADNCSAESCIKTVRGEIGFAWEKKGNVFTAEIVLPKYCEASLRLPGKEPIDVAEGKMRIVLD